MTRTIAMRSLHAGCALGAVLAATPSLAQQARPGDAQCPVANGEATCSGSVPGGIRVVDGDNVSSLIVRDLAAPIAPPVGTSGVDFRRATGPVTVRTLAGPNGMTIRGSADGIRAESAGDVRVENALGIALTVPNSLDSGRPSSAAIRAVGFGAGSIAITNSAELQASISSQNAGNENGAIVAEARGAGRVTIDNSGTIRFGDVSANPITASSPGALSVELGGGASGGVTLRNSGALILDRGGAGISVTRSGFTTSILSTLDVENRGDITGRAGTGILVSEIIPVAGSSLRIFNSGRIALDSTGISGGVTGIDLTFRDNDAAGATIVVRNEGAIALTGTANHGIDIIVNSSTGSGNDGRNFLDLTNTGAIDLANGRAGIQASAPVFRIANSGAITVQGPSTAFSGAAITASANFLGGAPTGLDLASTLENSGALTVRGPQRDGMELNAGSRLTATNSGAIDADGALATGITVNSLVDAAVANSGAIVTRGAGGHGVALYEVSLQTDAGIAAAGVRAEADLNGSIAFAHSGSIQALGAGADGIHAQTGRGDQQLFGNPDLAEEACDEGLVIYCTAGQQFSTRYNGAVTVNVAAGATVSGGSGTGAGVSLTGIGTHVLDNSGTIGALSGRAVLGGVGRDTVINRGTLNGSVALGDGDDAFVLFANGNLPAVDGGAGNDVFALESGAGETVAFDVARAGGLAGFELFAKRGAGVVALTGTAPAALPRAIAVEGGTLLANTGLSGSTTEVRAGAALGGTGSLGATTVRDGGTLSPGGDAVGTLTLASLLLSPGSVLRYDLGRPGAVGGADNDLVTITGNLTLDGTLNVIAQPSFGQDVYRLVNYGGTLIDSGLAIGSGVGQAQLQTAIAGQVNLVVGVTNPGPGPGPGPAPNIQFWDGADTAADGTIDGGSGSWNTSTTNWTRPAGDVNDPWGGNFAVFQATPGTVTIDPAGVSATGVQFAVGGYALSGGTLTLAAPATLRVGDGSTGGAGMTGTIAATIAGAAGVDKTDLGTLVLGGANSYGGGTTISGGVLQVTGDGNLGAAGGGVTLNGGTLRFGAGASSARGFTVGAAGGTLDTGANALTLSGAIGGGGALLKTGAGALTLSGNSSAFAGAVTLAGGSLRLDGSLGGALAVNAGTRLTGTGTLRNLTAAGIVAPGNSIGTLNASGNVTFASGSTFEVEVDPNGSSDRFAVAGAATLQGGTVSALFLGNQSGACGAALTSTILTAQGGVSGTFAGVTANFAFLTPSLSYDANNVRLTLTRSTATFGERGATANQRASAAAAEALRCGNAVFDAIVPLTAAGAHDAFDQLSGEVHVAAPAALLEDSRFFREAMLAPRQGRGVWAGLRRVGQDRWRRQCRAVRPRRHRRFRRPRPAVRQRLVGERRRRLQPRRLCGRRAPVLSRGRELASRWDAGGAVRPARARGGRRPGVAPFRRRSHDRLRRLCRRRDRALRWRNAPAVRAHRAGAAARRHRGRTLRRDRLGRGRGRPVRRAWGRRRAVRHGAAGRRAVLHARRARLGGLALTGRLGWRHAFDADPGLATLAFAGGNGFTIAAAPISEDALVAEAGVELDLGRGARIGVSYSGRTGDRSKDHGARAMLTLPF